jgi:hypothetical protein
MKKFETPVLLITFNRPDVTQRVLNRILEMNPPIIYFFNDAPRPGNKKDQELCAQIRKMAANLDFDGILKTRFEEKNLGCKMGESTAMSWLFENEEMGIVIEDDILPTTEFFWYCQEMLEKYKDDPRVFSITGCNLLNEWKQEYQDYHFALFGSFWGWAGWRRAWQFYDVEASLWKDEEVRRLVLNYLPSPEYRRLRKNELDSILNNSNSTWDFQFCLIHYLHHAMSIVPSRNMVENIGINREDAVHMTGESPFSDLRNPKVSLPMKHNPIMVPDMEYDELVIRKAYPWLYEPEWVPPPPRPRSLKRKVLDKIRSVLK